MKADGVESRHQFMHYGIQNSKLAKNLSDYCHIASTFRTRGDLKDSKRWDEDIWKCTYKHSRETTVNLYPATRERFSGCQ